MKACQHDASSSSRVYLTVHQRSGSELAYMQLSSGLKVSQSAPFHEVEGIGKGHAAKTLTFAFGVAAFQTGANAPLHL